MVADYRVTCHEAHSPIAMILPKPYNFYSIYSFQMVEKPMMPSYHH